MNFIFQQGRGWDGLIIRHDWTGGIPPKLTPTPSSSSSSSSAVPGADEKNYNHNYRIFQVTLDPNGTTAREEDKTDTVTTLSATTSSRMGEKDFHHLLQASDGEIDDDVAFGGDGLQNCVDASAEIYELDDGLGSFETEQECNGFSTARTCTTVVSRSTYEEHGRLCETLGGFEQRYINLTVACYSYHEDVPGRRLNTNVSFINVPDCFDIEACQGHINNDLCEKYGDRYALIWKDSFEENNHYGVNCYVTRNDCQIDYEVATAPPVDDENNTLLIVGIVVGVVLVLAIVVAIIIVTSKKNRDATTTETGPPQTISTGISTPAATTTANTTTTIPPPKTDLPPPVAVPAMMPPPTAPIEEPNGYRITSEGYKINDDGTEEIDL